MTLKKPAILVTAGPTREKIDPVRFISNYSTGTFGYEIAHQAQNRGWQVVLVSGPVSIHPPSGIKPIMVETALEMRRVVLREAKKCDIVIMAAAVSDWRAACEEKKKMKKSSSRAVRLVENPDILKELGNKKRGVLVGFCLETDNLEENAKRKLKQKNLDIIVANKLKAGGRVFGDHATSVLILDKKGIRQKINNRSKKEVAKIILDKALKFTI